MSMLRLSILLVSLAGASVVMADGTGPTHPDKARQHPLDSSEPRGETGEQPQEAEQLEAPVLQPRQAPIETDVPPMPEPRDEQPGSDVDAAGNRVLRS
ncbi:hypothetical protein PSCT_02455 [Pseudomonas sp. SCT]|jgi:hypothetical protein|uniref:Uncharacterized protein n=1 Tax=Stutzerimonas stutzeri RCH2 TaxID=644801 RepID=L0GSR0_STUST|nr:MULTISPECIES: hypothetical protein [Pseudomonadaceae]AGA88349.1 hypothetical protein Psest_3874 [Stutzerimonas stutzeri RCH2]GCA56255.1 hypothetical protein PSCT_02455 [Pseudomonas sp. SCT]